MIRLAVLLFATLTLPLRAVQDQLAAQLAGLPDARDAIEGADGTSSGPVDLSEAMVDAVAAHCLAVRTKPKKSWQAQYSRRTTAAIAADERVVITFLARAVASPRENGTVSASVHLGLAAKPYTKFLRGGFEVAGRWQR